MRPGPSTVSRLILDTLSMEQAPARVIEFIVAELLEQKWESTATIAREKAEHWEKSVLSKLRTEYNASLELGKPSRIAFNSSSPNMIQGACFIEPNDSAEVREQKRKRLRWSQYHNALMGLGPEEFEMLCGTLVELLGVSNARVTRHSGDEGIDFLVYLHGAQLRGKRSAGSATDDDSCHQTAHLPDHRDGHQIRHVN